MQEWVKTTLQKDLYLGRCYEFLDAVGYSEQVPRPRRVEADQERQDDFKKKSSPKLSRQWKRVLNKSFQALGGWRSRRPPGE